MRLMFSLNVHNLRDWHIRELLTNSETGKREERGGGYYLQKERGRHIQRGTHPGIPQVYNSGVHYPGMPPICV